MDSPDLGGGWPTNRSGGHAGKTTERPEFGRASGTRGRKTMGHPPISSPATSSR